METGGHIGDPILKGRRKEMRDVSIVGVGMHPWGKWPERKFVEFGLVAAKNALKDANMEWKDVQFLVGGSTTYSGIPGVMDGSVLTEEMGWTGIPVINHYNACATGAYSVDVARARIMSGLCDVALCVGMDSAPKGFFGPTETKDPNDLDILRFKMGATNPAYFAMYARRRMEECGTTEEDLAAVKVKNSRHGLHNPYARYRKEFTREEVLASPMVADPLRLYELCATSDGAAAVILANTEVAKRFNSNPLSIAAVSAISPRYPDAIINLPRVSTDSTSNVAPDRRYQKMVADMAYEDAGIGPEDLDFAEVYDLSSAWELDWYEYIGLCEPGGAERLLRDRDTALGGRIPVNPSGGLSCFGEAAPAQGLAQLCELVWQLRGTAGKRQVEGAKVGLSINFGLQGNCSCMILKK
jgi:acetyl-CoA acetyltransferase